MTGGSPPGADAAGSGGVPTDDASTPGAACTVGAVVAPGALRSGRTLAPHRRPRSVAPAPAWVAPTFLLFAAALVPWTVYLAMSLPRRNLSGHWDVAWVGFDAALFLTLAGTAWFAYRNSTWVAFSATSAATLLLCDAWFDVTTSRGGWNLASAVVEALLLELPLAALCLWIARHAEQINERTTLMLVRHSERLTDRLRGAERTGAGSGGRADG